MLRNSYTKALTIALATVCTSQAFAQKSVKKTDDLAAQQKMVLELHPFYKSREAAAPPNVKQKLAELRNKISAQKLDFAVGYTTAMDIPLSKLAGGRPGTDIQERGKRASARGQEFLQADLQARQAFIKANPNFRLPDPPPVACSATLHAFDFRRSGKVTPVRNQMNCGSCWDFAAFGALESSYLIRNNLSIDGSEQQVLSCAHVGSCGGSWYDGVFDYMITHGAAKESDYPYVGFDAPCAGTAALPYYRAVAHGVIHPEVAIPTPAQIKEGLCQHGPLAVGVLATDLFQGSVGNTVLNEPVPLTVVGSDGRTYYNVNHCVLIVGWDDTKQAWLVKNSWGTGWGSDCGYGSERGYIWIHYGANNIGLQPGWVQARSEHYFPNIEIYRKYFPKFEPIKEISIKKNL